ncbi:MAG: YihA family ribosome biogenesis GTP-binding protein [Bacteroidetes bacterium]|nr:MAG: YihA family ribosome biogenesis GTP-binding protein [Bacteroidota bacterium]RLD93245.1 MAG: YihA family ribosome biogenesis GTP-binding protein [Bacteroidota bacterium]RLE05657.1 MAG: YihA family ribosome biogenesis GTP-binding protein [Bacteroidota bacterium]
MKITKAEFICSNTRVDLCPQEAIPEYAFIGRSNVGKSSLINMLVERKKLAKTSSTPGKTRLINHFKINDQWFLCDLPGYGYAKVSKKERESFALMIEKYATQRSNLVCFFVLIDARIPPQQLDLDFIEWLGDSNLPFVIVFTKIDKINQTGKSKNLELLKAELLQSWEELPMIFETSAVKGTGKEQVMGFIEETNLKLV